MTPRDWFGVLVRGGGLYMFVIAIGQAVAAMAQYDTGWERDRSHVAYCLIYLVLGSIALRGADMIVRFAYPDEPIRSSNGDDKSEPK